MSTTSAAGVPVRTGLLIAAAAAGGAVALAPGTDGRVHEPTGGTITTFGFPSLLAMKAWLATAAAGLALAQLVSALVMWGRLPGVTPAPWSRGGGPAQAPASGSAQAPASAPAPAGQPSAGSPCGQARQARQAGGDARAPSAGTAVEISDITLSTPTAGPRSSVTVANATTSPTRSAPTTARSSRGPSMPAPPARSSPRQHLAPASSHCEIHPQMSGT